MADEQPKGRFYSPEEGVTRGPSELSARFSEGALRRYLLGFYHPLMAEGIDVPVLSEGADPILDVIEDELIEEYVTGEMSDGDRLLFEGRFLFNEERLEKIRLCAMLLGRAEVAEGLTQRVASLREDPQFWNKLWNTQRQPTKRGVPVPMAEAVEPQSAPAPNLGPILDAGPKSSIARVWLTVGCAALLCVLAVSLLFTRRGESVHTLSLKAPTASVSGTQSPAAEEAMPHDARQGRGRAPYVASAEVSEDLTLGPSRHSRHYTLTVKGSGFQIGSVVWCNGKRVLTEFVSPTKLVAYIGNLSESDYEKLRSAEVVVAKFPDGRASSPVKVTVKPEGGQPTRSH